MFELEYQVVPNVKSSDELHHLTNILAGGHQRPFASERFPLYPIDVLLSLRGDPFDFVEVSCPTELQPSVIAVQFSNDGQKFSQVGELRFMPELNHQTFVVRSLQLPNLVSSQFVRFRIMGCLSHKENLCKQVGIHAVRLYNRQFRDTKFLFNVEAEHLVSRPLLELLKCLEWTKCKAKQQDNLGTCIDSQRQIEECQRDYERAKHGHDKERLVQLQQQYLSKAKKYKQTLSKTERNPSKNEASPPKKAIDPNQQSQSRQPLESSLPFSKPTLPKPIPNATRNVFGRYADIIDQTKLRLISSERPIDHEKYLIDLWEYLKSKPQPTVADEELAMDSIGHFMHSTEIKVVGLALQVLNMMCKKQKLGRACDKKYDELVNNLLAVHQRSELTPLRPSVQQALLAVYPIIKPDRYLDVMLNFPGKDIDELKLAILEQILNHHQLKSTVGILNYLKKLFRDRTLSKPTKSSAVEVLSVISGRTSIDKVVQHFQDLPAHEVLNIERLIKEKLGLSNQPSHRSPQPELEAPKASEECAYCHLQDPNFLDADLYDMHCFRDCVYLCKCRYCEAVIEIPQLHQHYLKECSESRNFKKCAECGLSLHLKEIEKHEAEECMRKPVIMCPLCTANFIGKAELSKHILAHACPNNERALPPPDDI